MRCSPPCGKAPRTPVRSRASTPQDQNRRCPGRYWAGYGLAFAGSFVATLAHEVTPEAVKRGYREGFQAGNEAARDWTGKMKRKEPETTAVPPLLLAGAEGAQPGATSAPL